MEVIRGHLGCPLSGGCPLFGGSAIGGSTVYIQYYNDSIYHYILTSSQSVPRPRHVRHDPCQLSEAGA